MPEETVAKASPGVGSAADPLVGDLGRGWTFVEGYTAEPVSATFAIDAEADPTDPSSPSRWPATAKATLRTDRGDIVIELFGDQAPQTVQNFGDLARDGYFDGMRFHRVVSDFVIQGGDPLTKDTSERQRWGTGGPGYTIVDEFACESGTVSHEFTDYGSREGPCEGEGGLALTHDQAGTVSMANKGEPNTGGSQFFITLGPQPRLDGTHPVFGEVVEGLDVVQEIGKLPTDRRDRPKEDVVVEEVEIEGELPGVEVQTFG